MSVLCGMRSSSTTSSPMFQPSPQRENDETASGVLPVDRKSTRLNSSHSQISYAVFCLKKKKTHITQYPDLRRVFRLALARTPFIPCGATKTHPRQHSRYQDLSRSQHRWHP